jgi:predicted ABC-type ATPase
MIVLGGPNGAGKSTFFDAFLAHLGLPFLNADRLARETTLDAYAAAREIAAIRDDAISRRQSFILETVLSDPVGDKVQMMASAAAAGYDVRLIFIGIADAGLSAERVTARAAAGGHDVPAQKIAARYPRTLANLERAIQLLPQVTVYDNSSYASPYELVGEFGDGVLTRRGATPPPAWAVPIIDAGSEPGA